MDSAYVMGRLAYSDGKTMSDNPYKAVTVHFRSWMDGWIAAVRSDPLLDEDERAGLIGEVT